MCNVQVPLEIIVCSEHLYFQNILFLLLSCCFCLSISLQMFFLSAPYKQKEEVTDWRKNVEAMSGMEGRKKIFNAGQWSNNYLQCFYKTEYCRKTVWIIKNIYPKKALHGLILMCFLACLCVCFVVWLLNIPQM